MIDNILISSTADCTVVTPIVNHMNFFAYCGNPGWKFLFRSAGTVTWALNTVLVGNSTTIIFQLITASFFVDYNIFTMMDFNGLSLTGTVIAATAVAANATNQALTAN